MNNICYNTYNKDNKKRGIKMRSLQFGIENKKDLIVTVMKFDNKYTLPLYIVEDKKGIRGSSRINWKRALYNYNKNKKRKTLQKTIDK